MCEDFLRPKRGTEKNGVTGFKMGLPEAYSLSYTHTLKPWIWFISKMDVDADQQCTVLLWKLAYDGIFIHTIIYF